VVTCVKMLLDDAARGLAQTDAQPQATRLTLPWGDQTIDYTPPWQRRTYGELFEQYVGAPMDDADAVRGAAEQHGLVAAGKHPDVLVHHLFEEKVEKHLIGPVFVHDYPASLCPLTKRKKGQPHIAERFELY